MLHSQESLWFFRSGHEIMIRQLANQYTEELPFAAGFTRGSSGNLTNISFQTA